MVSNMMNDGRIGASQQRWSSFALFALGLFSDTKIFLFGCVSISELIVFTVAPIIFCRNYRALRRDGFTPVLTFIMVVMGSMFFSSWYNHTPFPFVFKAFATIYSVWAYFIVYHSLLRNNLLVLKWIFIGYFLSTIITIFALNPTAQVGESGFAFIGNAETEEIFSSALFWTSRVRSLLQIPLCGFYLQTPLLFSLLTPVVFIAVAVFTTASGRAASLAILMTGAMILIGRKKRKTMREIGRYFFVWLLIGVVFLFLFKGAYKYAATSGWLGDVAQSKYERQSRKGGGILTLLMAGRTGFFTAIRAGIDRPLVGWGPGAEDVGGYALKYALKYGDEDDIQFVLRAQQRAMALGYRIPIPTHSYMMGAWVHYGLAGLLFYLWVLYLVFCHIRRFADAIPQWYGYFAMFIPMMLWNIFFSPFNTRWQFALFMACLFFARAVGRRLMQLPIQVEMEARRYER